MSAHVILLCPCCASATDAAVTTDVQTFDCATCGQRWWMRVDADRQARHSLT